MKNKVFISSTCYDLIDLRVELKEFINSRGLTPIMSDHPDTDFVTFKDKNSIETCLINLKSCNVVIVILSQRYGPSLKDAGFTDHSATHLEYLTAVNENIKTVVFVRDRLEAEYNVYIKAKKDKKVLQWIKDKDLKLFDIIEQHKKLANDNRNNWYWTFRNSLDIKERLNIDLKTEIDTTRLNQLIESGNCPLLTVAASGHAIENTTSLFVKLFIENLGNQSAIEPIAVIFKADSYTQIIEQDLNKNIINYEIRYLKSLRAGEKVEINFELYVSPEEKKAKGKVKSVIEIVYRTIYGDLISDISELEIYINVMRDLTFFTKYTTKRYRGGSAYEILGK